jgi:hypothetical protein
LRHESYFQRKRRRRLVLFAALIVALAPDAASAEGLFDFLFAGPQKPQQRQSPTQATIFDPFGTNPQAPPPARAAAASSGPAFCVRSCDGRYFPLMRGGAFPVQMCQAFCPASPTKVFYGSSIDKRLCRERRARELHLQRPHRRGPGADRPCARQFAARRRRCRHHQWVGGLFGRSDRRQPEHGLHAGRLLPGLTSEVRARLGKMKVAPVSAEMIAGDAPLSDASVSATPLPRSPWRRKRSCGTSAPKRIELHHSKMMRGRQTRNLKIPSSMLLHRSGMTSEFTARRSRRSRSGPRDISPRSRRAPRRGFPASAGRASRPGSSSNSPTSR